MLTQAFFDVKYLFTVHKGSFNPPPKVESAVIRLTRKPNQTLGCDPVLFKSLVKLTFGQRRKMLRNTLRAFLQTDDLLQDAFFDKRPEQLTVADFVALTNRIAALQPPAE